jgi:cytochrome c biogenesis protein CcmG/thiol:disulfide interchange protein DsbE
VNVFASWCISCNAEHATLVKLAKTHQLPIYGLNWKDKDENAKAWLEKHGNPYTQIGKDPDGRVAVELGITGAPESWLVDKNGIIIYHLAGGLTDQIVQEEVLPLLAGNRQ